MTPVGIQTPSLLQLLAQAQADTNQAIDNIAQKNQVVQEPPLAVSGSVGTKINTYA